MRDGLSLLDQAIALGQGEVTPEIVRSMLGLADRGRIFDLLECVFRGDTKAALAGLDALHRDGAEPGQVLADLAEAVHAAARCKAAGADAGAEGLSAEEKRRAAALADRLSTPLLARAWQMLLKGWEEAAKAPNGRAAAEMVLIRIAYTADLPAPDEVIRSLGGPEAAGARRRQGARRATTAARAPRRSTAPLTPCRPQPRRQRQQLLRTTRIRASMPSTRRRSATSSPTTMRRPFPCAPTRARSTRSSRLPASAAT